jgi:predicted transcriptional regulator
MANLLDMATNIVSAHASNSAMSKAELLAELQDVYFTLSRMEGDSPAGEMKEEEGAPAVSRKKAFGKNQVFCMLCGKGMKTLGRHLRTAHDMKPIEYRKKFGIPRSQSLASKAYSETRRQMAVDRGLGENLARARAEKRSRQ